MLPAHAPFRGISVFARNHAPPARRTAEEAGPAGRVASCPLSGLAQAARIHPYPEGTRSLSDPDGDRALGRHSYGRRARTTFAASTPQMRQGLRSGHGLLRMRRAAFGQGGSYSPRPWCSTHPGAGEAEGKARDKGKDKGPPQRRVRWLRSASNVRHIPGSDATDLSNGHELSFPRRISREPAGTRGPLREKHIGKFTLYPPHTPHHR